MQTNLTITGRSRSSVSVSILAAAADDEPRRNRTLWLPLSQVQIGEDGRTVVEIADWLAHDRGITSDTENGKPTAWRRVTVPATCVQMRDEWNSVRLRFPAGSALAGFSVWVPRKLVRPEQDSPEDFQLSLPDDFSRRATLWDSQTKSVTEERELSAADILAAFADAPAPDPTEDKPFRGGVKRPRTQKAPAKKTQPKDWADNGTDDDDLPF